MKQFADLMVLFFVVSSVLSVGLNLTVSEIVAPLRRPWLVAVSLLVNFVLAPALAVVIARVLSLSEPQSVGLILLGAAAGAPFLPKLAEVSKGDVAFSVALMVLLMAGSLVYLPFVLPRLLPGVSVNSLRIGLSLLLTMILPLCVGLCVKARSESLAVRLRTLMSRVSNISLIIVLALILATNWQNLLKFVGMSAIVASVLFVGIAFISGYCLGGSKREARQVLGFGTAARNIPAALLVGSQNFDDPNVAIMVIVVALLSLVVFGPLAISFGRHHSAMET